MCPGDPTADGRDAEVLDVDLLHFARGCAIEDGKDGVVGHHGRPPDGASSPVLATPEEVTKSREGGRRGLRRKTRRRRRRRKTRRSTRSSGFVLGAIHVCVGERRAHLHSQLSLVVPLKQSVGQQLRKYIVH